MIIVLLGMVTARIAWDEYKTRWAHSPDERAAPIPVPIPESLAGESSTIFNYFASGNYDRPFLSIDTRSTDDGNNNPRTVVQNQRGKREPALLRLPKGGDISVLYPWTEEKGVEALTFELVLKKDAPDPVYMFSERQSKPDAEIMFEMDCQVPEEMQIKVAKAAEAAGARTGSG